LPGGDLTRTEDGGDLVVREVVSVAKDDGGTFLLGQAVGELCELLVCRRRILRRLLDEFRLRPGATEHVRRDVARDREHPRPQVLAVLESTVRAERSQECLLKGVVRSLAPESAAQEAHHLAAVLVVEALERWDRHRLHHVGQRTGARICEHLVVIAGVVGHVEYIEFVPVEHVPAPGEIVHAGDTWEQAAGGGSVAAVQLSKLADEVHFFTALGVDALGRSAQDELTARGITVHATLTDAPQRRGFVYLDETGERTITTIGPRTGPRGHDDSLPWHELARCEAVYFCAGDVDALLHARRAAVLVATARDLATLRRGAVQLDALVRSGKDEAERYQPGDLAPAPHVVVTTSGALGGWSQPGGPFSGGTPPDAIADTYGAGDCFAAGLTFALGSGVELAEALAFAARCGAGALAGPGVHAEAVEL
jgi:ribokinase